MSEVRADAAHQGFIDWMKAIGMVLIVVGHVVGAPDSLFNSVSAPIYSKQLGVAFFVFIAGWGLARNTYPRLETVYRRLFEIVVLGLICAVFMSAVTWVTVGDLAESNYLPLVGGVNVFLNYFPANPTTWYIGMYIHLMLFWFLFLQRGVAVWWLPIALIAEILIRAGFLHAGLPFTGYMMLTNWLSVFLIGYQLAGTTDHRATRRAFGFTAIWAGVLYAWLTLQAGLSFDGNFPTRLPSEGDSSLLLASFLVTAIYLFNTLMAFTVFRSIPVPRAISFIARHTLLIFILHMPLIYAVSEDIYAVFPSPWMGKTAMTVIVFSALGLLSHVAHHTLRLPEIRAFLWRNLVASKAAVSSSD
ncbi:MAG: hypothetical protein Cons2KO_30350 [Congregibacter sp.]